MNRARPDMETVLTAGPVIAVLSVDDPGSAVPLATALQQGGVRVIEITLRTAAALESIERIAARVPDVIVGCGTIVRAGDLRRAASAGAAFVVSPGCTDALFAAAADLGIPYLPGVATGSEILRALDAGYNRLKLFPAEACGGPAAVSAFAGPFPQIRFCPTGGIDARNAANYLALPNVACVGGSWVAPAEAIAGKDWGRVEALARQAAALRRG
jgi:2-dehydro-3-deoxyphosphogluconate aldolase/(4S)-4-hydroxy-2-oxoglutarate aldolase